MKSKSSKQILTWISILAILVTSLLISRIPLPPVGEPSPTSSLQPADLSPASITATREVSASITETSTPLFIEANPLLAASQSYSIGELDLNYPPVLAPNTSEIVFLKILIPEELEDVPVTYFDRVGPWSSQPSMFSGFANYSAPIYITSFMRVTLSSPSFQVVERYPSWQRVDIKTINNPTYWAWTIKAPGSDSIGSHILVLELYLENAQIPSWFRSIEIEVANPTSTPTLTPTMTQTPTSTLTLTPTITLLPHRH